MASGPSISWFWLSLVIQSAPPGLLWHVGKRSPRPRPRSRQLNRLRLRQLQLQQARSLFVRCFLFHVSLVLVLGQQRRACPRWLMPAWRLARRNRLSLIAPRPRPSSSSDLSCHPSLTYQAGRGCPPPPPTLARHRHPPAWRRPMQKMGVGVCKCKSSTRMCTKCNPFVCVKPARASTTQRLPATAVHPPTCPLHKSSRRGPATQPPTRLEKNIAVCAAPPHPP